MPFPKGDPRAKAAGRKGGLNRVRNAREDKIKAQARLPLVGPARDITPAKGERLDPRMEAIRMNAELLKQVAEYISPKVVIGILGRFVLDEAAATSDRIRAGQTILRFVRGEQIDPEAIGSAIVAAEGADVDIEELELEHGGDSRRSTRAASEAGGDVDD